MSRAFNRTSLVGFVALCLLGACERGSEGNGALATAGIDASLRVDGPAIEGDGGGEGVRDAGVPSDVLEVLPTDAGSTEAGAPPAADVGPGCALVGCPDGQFCDPETDVCASAGACRSNLDCEADEICLHGGGAWGLCRPAPPSECDEAQPCTEPRLCDVDIERCVSSGSCRGDGDCAPGTLCDVDAGLCLRCRDDGDCGGGMRCVDDGEARQTCSELSPCATDADCRPGRGCVEGACGPEDCSPDRFEDDDLPGRAALLTAHFYEAMTLCGHETDDWSRLRVPAGLGVRALLQPRSPAGVSLDLALYSPHPDAAPALEMSAVSAGPNRWVARAPQEEASELMLRVVGLTGATVTYDLDIRFFEGGPCVDDFFDRGPGSGRVAPVPPPEIPLRLCPGDEDVYVFDATPGAEVVATLWAGGARGSVSVEIWGEQGELVDAGVAIDGGWRATAMVDAAASFRLMVRGESPVGGEPYSLTLQEVVGEVRQLCEEALELQPGTTAGVLEAGGGEMKVSCGIEGGPSLVQRIQLEEERGVLLKATGASVALRRDCAVAESEVACVNDAELMALGALQAGTYAVVLQGTVAGAAYSLEYELVAPPPTPAHRHCDAAAPLFPGEQAVGATWTADDAFDATLCPGGALGGRDVFYRLRTESLATLSFDLRSSFPAILAVMDACDGALLGCGGDQLLLPPGEYIVVVDGQAAQHRGGFELLAVSGPPPPPPENRNCEDARLVEPGVRLEADTLQAEDGAQPRTCGPAAEAGGQELVYRLPSERVDGTIVVDLFTNFEALAYVRDGCEEDSLELACRRIEGDARLRLIDPGSDLYLFVDGVGVDDHGLLSVVSSRPPRNDPPCGEGLALVAPVEVGGSTLGNRADADPGPGCAGPFPLPGPDVTYTLQVAAGARLEAIVRPDGWDAALYLLDSCGPEAGCLAGADRALSGGAESLEWEAEADGLVFLVVDSFGGAGDYRLQVVEGD